MGWNVSAYGRRSFVDTRGQCGPHSLGAQSGNHPDHAVLAGSVSVAESAIPRPRRGTDRQALQRGARRAGVLPKRLVRGVDRDVRTVAMPKLIIYARADLPDEMAYLLARAYDLNHAAFLETPLHTAYDQDTVADAPIPLHPGAQRYYRERGCL
ncbi:MAG: hypothetical protein GEU73_04630 [Chloroflexi bacterium]|nr:hypothetical protein [Chloroflexota bacterium]